MEGEGGTGVGVGEMREKTGEGSAWAGGEGGSALTRTTLACVGASSRGRRGSTGVAGEGGSALTRTLSSTEGSPVLKSR